MRWKAEPRGILRFFVYAVAATAALCGVLSSPPETLGSDAAELGFRAGFSGLAVTGRSEYEDFSSFDILGVIALPWESYNGSDWGLGTRVLFSAGIITGGGDTAGVLTCVPGFKFGPRSGFLEIDMGVGLALLSGYHFGYQTLGGPLQVTWDMGIKFDVYRGLKVGYILHHLSDAGMYDQHAAGHLGLDLHSIEASYRF